MFDLDEVLLRPSTDPYLEKPLIFPFNLLYPQRLRLGVPALFYFFKNEGYDIWFYSSGYHSFDDVVTFFRHSDARIDGAITGIDKNELGWKKMEEMLAN